MVLLLSGFGGARRRGAAWSILLLAILSFGAAAEAQRPEGGPPRPPAAARRRAVVVGHFAVRSFEAMEELAEEVGVPLPPMLTAAGLEGQLPFLGEGSLATDQPAGMVMFAVPGVAEESGMAFVLPLNPGKATIESFVQLGGRRVAGRGDVVMLNARLFRRTDKYLLFGSPDDGVFALDDAVIAGAMKDPAAVARLVVDLKSMKHTRPRSYDEFFGRALRNAGATRGEQAGAQLAIDFVKGLDGLTFGVNRDGGALRLLMTMTPLPMPAITKGVIRPGMPAGAGVVARFDLACPPTKAIPVLDAQSFRKLLDQSTPAGARVKPGHRDRVLDVMTRASQVLLGADATSVAERAGSGDGKGGGDAARVVYVVNQYTRPVDVLKEVRDVARQLNAASAEVGGDEPTLELSTYESAGATVTRVKVLDRRTPTAFIDLVQRDRTVYFTFSRADKRFIQDLLSAKPQGAAMSRLGSGTIDAGALVESVATAPNSPFGATKPLRLKQVCDAMRGQSVALTAVSELDGVTVSVTVPTGLIKKAVATANGGAAKQ